MTASLFATNVWNLEVWFVMYQITDMLFDQNTDRPMGMSSSLLINLSVLTATVACCQLKSSNSYFLDGCHSRFTHDEGALNVALYIL